MSRPGEHLWMDPQGRWPLPWLEPAWNEARRQRGHALLIHGPGGVGQFELAMLLAQTWLCEQPRQGQPCGVCEGCRLLGAFAHPDLRVLVPEQWRERLGLAAAEEEGAEAGEAGGSAAGKGKAAGREIRVGEVRAAIDWAQRTSTRGGLKVLVLHPAQRLNLIAANALLKTLEEPPGALRLVLCCEDPQALLPTVRSRCQMLGLRVPDAAAAVSWLQSHGVEDAALLLQAAGGRPAQALELAQEGISARLWPEMPDLVRQGRAEAFAALPAPRVIECLQKLCLDLLNRSRRQPSRYFPPESLPPGAHGEALLAWWGRLQRAVRHREHPWNANLLIESLVLQGRDCWPARQDRTPSSRHVR